MTVALIYHDLAGAGHEDSTGFPGPAAARYKLDPAAFDTHLEAIARTGARVGLAAERPELTLTFDDGGASSLAIASALEHHGWRGHFFITTGRIGTPGFLTEAEIAGLDARGHDIGSHSQTHPTYMGRLGPAELAEEWRASRDRLSEILGRPILTAAVPGGFLSREVIQEAADAGYQLLMTSEPRTRERRHEGLTVQGRYTIWSTTGSERVAAYARADRRVRAELWLAWQVKTAAKRASPSAYERLRQTWAGRRGSAPE